jgi:putative ATPase
MYAHDYEGAMVDQEYFPEQLAGREYYKPRGVGREDRLAEYLKKFKDFRRKSRAQKKSADPKDSSGKD